MWPTFQAGSFSKKVQQDAREDRRAGKAPWRAASAAWERRRALAARVAVQTVSLLSTRAAGSMAQPVSSPAKQTAEADRGRHPGFASFNVLAGGPGSLGLAFGPRIPGNDMCWLFVYYLGR
jgi:hypothetical protein